VTGKGIEVDPEVAHVERAMRSTLRAVEHDFRSDSARRRDDCGDVGDCAGYVRAMRKGNKPAPGGQFRFQPIEIKPPLRRHRQEP
jgi:hypothetical protein